MHYRAALLHWIPLATAISIVCLLVYVTAQQSYRQSLNDPQIQMAEDGARLLESTSETSLVSRTVPIDMSASLSPWIAVYDEQGKVVESSGLLDGKSPQVPIGVLMAAKNGLGKDTIITGQNRVSWQPRDGVRSAIIVQHIQGDRGGFVVAGRNMREIEQREAKLLTIVGALWLAALVCSFVLQISVPSFKRT